MSARVTDAQIKALLMLKLFDRECWCRGHIDVDDLVRGISRKIGRNGKRARKMVNQLVRHGYVWRRKKRERVCLNPRRRDDIMIFMRSAGIT